MPEELRNIKDRIKLRRHGPAVQMDVMEMSSGIILTKKLYSVDMVPTIQTEGADGEDEYYVAKPIKGRRARASLNSWRQSFSLEEKALLSTLDQYNGCHKQVLRILKVMRNRESWLTSYHFKTALLYMADELEDPEDGRDEHIGQRLMDVLSEMEMGLGEGKMPSYFQPGINLLDGVKKTHIIHVRTRMERLIHKEARMMKLLRSV